MTLRSMLAGIALLPLLAAHWWERNRNRAVFSGLVAGPMAVWLFFVDAHALEHSLIEYTSFLVLLGALYVIAGGIHVSNPSPG